MDLKLVLFVLVFIITLLKVEAEFFYNRVLPKQDQLQSLELKCVPGRTIIKVESPAPLSPNTLEDSEENPRRTHTRWQTEDTSCQICVCSVNGKNEYCSKRPAMNVNECMRMSSLMKRFQSNEPYDHETSLSQRIRRDYIWHNDEIPYESKAKCRRGHSYYSNSITANDTDIDVASDVESLLDYSNKSVCFYCICNMAGTFASCISRRPWYCEYFRDLRETDAMRDKYRTLLGQDRPKFYRTLSWRLRRTMDNGMFDLVDSGGDALCCDHPDGHRRHLHHQIRNKIRLMKKKYNKENLLSNAPAGDYVDFIVNNDKLGDGKGSEYCVPFVSEYSDCTENNLCSGCSRCTCSAEGRWSCNNVKMCPDEDGDYKNMEEDFDENDVHRALIELEDEMKHKERKAQMDSKYPLVPGPQKDEDVVLEMKEINMEDEILKLMRLRRSADDMPKENYTIKFHNTVDEINEDTLKNTNQSGTLHAKKIELVPQISRRTSNILNDSLNSLHIEYSQPKDKSHHDDNKVDTPAIHDDKEDLLVHSNIYNLLGNQSQERKDKELSKLLVNELKRGENETIGEKNAPVISNITFTPENDTITAMAFIAGNLLNKLWNIEKDASDDNLNIEQMKREKIADLLELFEEPLSMRQEMFLKNALEQIHTAINNNKDGEDISLCKKLKGINKMSEEKMFKPKVPERHDSVKYKEANTDKPTNKVIAKINNVLNLINKYENVQNNLDNMKSDNVDILRTKMTDKSLTVDEISSLNLYGKALRKITKLLVPSKKNRKVVDTINHGNLFMTEESLKTKLSDYNLDITNVTAKDRMLLDYLAHIQNNPDCLLKKHRNKVSPSTIEGNILLNLSEFFKIKSLSDLVKQVETEERSSPTRRQTTTQTTVTTQKTVTKATTEHIEKGSYLFRDTKERLKGHLKSILEDLVDLQKLNGKDTMSKDIQVIEALPCIYKLLNEDNTETIKTLTTTDKATTLVDVRSPTDKIHEIFSNLRKELQISQTRRTNSLNGPQPKSAIVWGRVIKNARRKQMAGARRNLVENAKTIEELKTYLHKIESTGSNTYKNIAFMHEVPPSERLLLMKTFNEDTKKYIRAMDAMAATLQTESSVTKEVEREFSEFIDNVAITISLNEKVVKNLNEPKDHSFPNIFNPNRKIENKIGSKLKTPMLRNEKNYETMLTRDQIVLQLIKNRIQLYVDTKEAAHETYNDINYNIAKKILSLLGVGKFELAKELYKIFASQKQNISTNIEINNDGKAREHSIRNPAPKRPIEIEPLIKFEEPLNTGSMVNQNQDHFIKHLLNLKNMKL